MVCGMMYTVYSFGGMDEGVFFSLSCWGGVGVGMGMPAVREYGVRRGRLSRVYERCDL